MRFIKVLLLFFATAICLSGCLKKDNMNIDGDNPSASVYTMEYIQSGGTTINSGLQYFGGGALTFPSSHTADTATFNVRLAGASPASSDISITVGQDTKALLDNFSKDSIPYESMPDSLYKFISNTAIIKKGETMASFKVIFYPSKINATKNYMLAATVVNNAGYSISKNFGHIYFHTIGNPIAGAYLWEFIRYNNQDGSGSPSTHNTGQPATFAPISPTVVSVPTGYYTQPNYLISFKNTGGVLSNFAAVIDPAQIPDYFTAGGVSIVTGPTITVSADRKSFTLKYVVFNGSAYRNITDIFTKP